MGNKIFLMAIIWGAVLVAYIMLGLLMPMHQQIMNESLVSFNATANMSHFPGTYDAVASSSVWLWFIPGPVGLVVSVIMLKRRN